MKVGAVTPFGYIMGVRNTNQFQEDNVPVDFKENL
jgi:hypothetical protein